MVIYYGIEIKQPDGTWKLEAFGCGTPFKFRSKSEAGISMKVSLGYEPKQELRVKEIERHEDWHSTPFGDIVTRIRGDIFQGTWDCKTSPTKKCQFNVVEDSACDNCLFCHGPEERK